MVMILYSIDYTEIARWYRKNIVQP